MPVMDATTTTQFETEAEQIAAEEAALAARKQELAARRDVVIDQDGLPVTDAPPPWPHQTMEFMGTVWEIRAPKTFAALFLGRIQSKHTPISMKNDLMWRFLDHVLSARSMERLMDRAFDHDDEMGEEHFQDLIRKIVEAGSDRPTKPTPA